MLSAPLRFIQDFLGLPNEEMEFIPVVQAATAILVLVSTFIFYTLVLARDPPSASLLNALSSKSSSVPVRRASVSFAPALVSSSSSTSLDTQEGRISPSNSRMFKRSTSTLNEEVRLTIAIKMKRRERNVFAEAPNIQISGAQMYPRFPKSADEKATILGALRSNFVFSTLPVTEVENLVDYLKKDDFPSGTVVITQGEIGDFFYVIATGTFAYYVDDCAVGSASTGELFGELSLMYNIPRSATVKASVDSSAWSINRETFRMILASAVTAQVTCTIEALKKVEILKELTPEQTESLASAVHLVTFSAGDAIVKKNEIGHIFYMIKSGTVMCSDIGAKGATRKLEAGEYFGEKALLEGAPRAANVTAESEVVVMALDREDFEKVLGPMKELLAANLNLRVLSAVPILAKLSDSKRTEVAQLLTVHTYKKDENIVTQGEAGTAFFIVKKGECLVKKMVQSLVDENGNVVNLKRLREGDFFGEMALINNAPRVCDVMALTDDCECYKLEKEAFDLMIVGSLSGIMQKTVSRRSSQNKMLIARSQSQDSVTTLREIPLDELKQIGLLGTGTFGRVSLVQHKKKGGETGECFALKALNKAHIIACRQQANVLNEKNTMLMCNSPFIVKLLSTYRDASRLYFLVEFCQGGDLYSILHTDQRDGVPEPQAKFYAVCVLLGLVHLAGMEIAYRDLKPENAMIDTDGYVKIIDMGFAKVVKNKTFTLCGTPEYLAPEIILGRGHNIGVDHWAFGILCYEMIAGYSPFADHRDGMQYSVHFDEDCARASGKGAELVHGIQGRDQVDICQNIVKGNNLEFPEGFNADCKSMIKKLLVKDPANRLGMTKGGVREICDQQWFKNIDMGDFMSKSVKAPWLPKVKNPTDTSNFDPIDPGEYGDKDFKDTGDWDEDF